MPGEPPDPGIVQSFLNAVASKSWASNHLVDPLSGAASYPKVVPSSQWPDVGQWAVEGSGLQLSQDTYTKLKGCTANNDGSCSDSAGNRYYLKEQPTGWASLVAA